MIGQQFHIVAYICNNRLTLSCARKICEQKFTSRITIIRISLGKINHCMIRILKMAQFHRIGAGIAIERFVEELGERNLLKKKELELNHK